MEDEIIQLADIQEFFDNMINNNVPITGKMLWGFYFTDVDSTLLEQVAQELQKQDFLVYGIYIAEDEEGKELDYFCLRVEKEGTYTPEELLQQSNDFYTIEQKYELQSYDGFDVNYIEENN